MGNNPIKCDGQYEIDLLAIDPVTLKKYHIESSVSASKGFSRLTAKAFNPDDLKIRVKVASARRTLGYWMGGHHPCTFRYVSANW
jgi:hypothetical protein